MLHVAKIALSVGEVATAHRLSKRSAARLAAHRAQDLGPSFIKLGQFASTRGDVLSPEYFQEFAKLRDDVRADAPDVVRRNVCRDLGVSSVREVFSEFDDEPVASASVAQVHRAMLKRTGQQVAVKVLKDGVKEGIENDLRAARAVAGVVARASPASREQVEKLIARYSAVLRKETDFVAEARAARDARRTLLDALGDEVIVPRPIIRRPGVIVMEFVPSSPIGGAREPRRITSLVMEAIFSLITAGECFHQDPHEGNLGVTSAGGRERLVIYDFGNVSSLPRTALDGLLEAGLAFQLKDASMLADALVKHDLVDLKGGDAAEVRPVLMDMIGQGFEYVRTMDIKSFDPKKLDKESAHKMALADEVNGVMRSITMAEGVCKSAYPGFDLQRSIDQYLAVHSAEIAARRARRDIEAVLGFPF